VNRHRLALRIDDIGASAKRYEIYARRDLSLGPLYVPGDFLFLKALPPFRAWGPYREMRPHEWIKVFELLTEFGAVLTVGVTAAWVNWDASLTPFPRKFPEEAAVLREGLGAGLIEIANHGLTHCVLENYAFRPAWRHGNRKAHREFWEHIPLRVQEDHLRRSQDILNETFGVDVVTFVPPGNVFTEATLEIAARYGLRVLSCETSLDSHPAMCVVGSDHVLAFHDREIVVEGVGWLRTLLEQHQGSEFCLVRDLAESICG